MDEIVAHLGPDEARALVAEMVRHLARDGRKDGEIGAALLLQLELAGVDREADLVVGYGKVTHLRSARRIPLFWVRARRRARA